MAARRTARLTALTKTLNGHTAGLSSKTVEATPNPQKRKATSSLKGVEQEQAPLHPYISGPSVVNTEGPSTPPKKRVKQSVTSSRLPPLATPNRSAVDLIAKGAFTLARGREATQPKPAAIIRLADPNTTQATLLPFEPCRLFNPRLLLDDSPMEPLGSRTTTANLLEEACVHLIRVDPRMKPLIERNYCRIFSPEGLAEKIDPFESLTSGIISQQVSGAAAKAVKRRFVELFLESPLDVGESDTVTTAAAVKRFPQPYEVTASSVERLRTAGLSQRKAEYILGLAGRFASGELTAQMLAEAPFEDVIKKLTAVRGLGRWSVEMFACFGLKRMDVFSLSDLGVQRGMAAFEGRNVAKLKSQGGKWKYMSEKEMEEISNRFRPYRSLFMWYMWRVEETEISTLE